MKVKTWFKRCIDINPINNTTCSFKTKLINQLTDYKVRYEMKHVIKHILIYTQSVTLPVALKQNYLINQ